MEFKGTPGPWRVSDNGVFFDIKASCDHSSLADTCGSQCAYDSNTHTKDGVAYANACLMAAAPDLLNALINLIEYWKLDETAEAHAAMIAINKALGRE